MTHSRSVWALRVASIAAIVALALMTWSFLDPRPIAMMAAMTVGQGLGTLSLALFVIVVGVDLLRERFMRAKAKAAESKEEEA